MLAFMQQAEGGNRLFGESVGRIIDAYNREPGTRLTAAQAATAESLYPGAAEAQAENTQHIKLLNDALQRSTPGTIEHQELANALLRGTNPATIDKARLEAQHAGRGLVDIPLTTPDGKPALGTDGKQIILRDVPTADIYKTLHGRQPGGITEQNLITNQRNARLDEEKLLEEAKKDEEIILGTKVNSLGREMGKNIDDPAIQPRLKSFNSNSDAAHVYVWEQPWEIGTFKNGPGKAKALKIPLPRIGEVQITARMASKAATRLGMTMKEYLESVQKNGHIKGKLPWQP